ncbi:pilus assembly protein PilY [Pseudomonas sp. CrR25]|nr:pilus assembly protein PilY [Pseudomonas sp. CrR25]
MKTPQNTLHRFALSMLSSLLIFSAANSYADDTEIFFGGPAIDDSVRPNVLFILDNSGSMAWRTSSNTNPSGSEQSRMQILKESFSTIINNAGAINAGIMVLNERSAYNDTRMVYPVTNIDAPLPSSVTQVASTPQITVSGDDATQSTLGGGAVINGNTLQMGYVTTNTTTVASVTSDLQGNDAFFQSRYSNINWACRMNEPGSDHNTNNDACGNNDRENINIRSNNDTNTGDTDPIIGTALLYFRNLSVPAAAHLEPSFRAYLDLRPTNSQNNSNLPTIGVTLQDSKTPAALNDLSQIDPGRTYLVTSNIATSSWNASSTTRLDVTDLVKQVLDNDAAALQQIFLKLRATSARDYTFCTRNCGTSNGVSNAPRLVISYDSTAVQNETKTVALRFQNVGIPQGATITSARLDFAPATANPDALTLQVQAEKVADAAVFSTGSDIAGRTPKTVALTSWSPPAWVNQSPAVHEEGPDVTAQVQEVVSMSSWCGNNAMAFYLTPTAGTGSRTSYSVDGAPGLQPTLTVTYSGGNGGCLNPIIEASVTNPKNDAYEENDDDMVLGGNTLPVDRSRFAARYENVPLVNGATILDTQVILTPANTVNSPNITTTVRFENADNSAPFTASDDDITDREDTADSSCQITNWVTGTPVVCNGAQLKTGLQSIVNRGGWAPGNALTVMSVQGGDSSLEVQAYESNPAQSIKLRIKVAHGGLASSNYTVRQHLNALVQAMNAGNGTPIVPTYYEAAQYLRGGRSGYTSPITSACQSTHVVVLTDGQANGYTDASRSGIGTWTGSTCTGDATDSDEKCGRTLATWLADTDQSTFDGDNFITTHTIGFALGALAPSTVARDFLTDLANNGEGNAYTAANASELSAAFSQILQNVLSTDTTFVSPGAAVNQFNRQSNKNEVYFALFKPSETNRWVGNIKRYALNNSSGEIILDADNVGAVDPLTGFFKTTARSFWTNPADGNNTALGGVANQLPVAASRKAFTYIGTSPVGAAVNLNSSTQLLTDTNTDITSAMLGATDATERTALINWIRGLNTDGSARKTIGDPLHSVPRLVTYECNTFTDSSLTQCASEDQSAFVGTNEGFVHAFDTNTGAEQLAFMPQELLGLIKDLKANARSTSLAPRKYGMDNTVAVWVNDANQNGVIYGGRDPDSTTSPPAELAGLNTGEFVYAYATMGRGGRSLYALDVTDRSNPKMLWFKNNASTGFERLGQTWSTPVVTTIDVNGAKTQVLLFAGGYDPNQDNVNARTADAIGNALYIVNAKTGALIWSASSATGHTLQLSKMLYSMPANVRVIDIDRDGLADQFFATDMGGQVWRFFINNGNAASSLVSPLDSGAGSTDDGVFANIIPADTVAPPETAAELESKLRRFYNEPSVALLTVAGGKTLVISVGSGYRGHPLDTGTDDRFYSFRTPLVYSNAPHTVLTESSLYDATSNLIQSGSSTEKADAASAFASSPGGWYIRLTNSGEKVLSDAVTFSGRVFFNTYEPATANNSCQAVQGIGRAYAVNLYDATPVAQNLDGTPGSRFRVLKAGGIPPRPIVLFPDAGSGQTKDPVVCIGTECTEVEWPEPGSTYWIDES